MPMQRTTLVTMRHGSDDEATLRDLLRGRVARFDPDELWLFGSRAEGGERPGSDWDILAVLPDTTPADVLDPVKASRRASDLGVALDVVPCTATEFAEERDEPGSLVWRVSTRGRRIYERRA